MKLISCFSLVLLVPALAAACSSSSDSSSSPAAPACLSTQDAVPSGEAKVPECDIPLCITELTAQPEDTVTVDQTAAGLTFKVVRNGIDSPCWSSAKYGELPFIEFTFKGSEPADGNWAPQLDPKTIGVHFELGQPTDHSCFEIEAFSPSAVQVVEFRFDGTRATGSFRIVPTVSEDEVALVQEVLKSSDACFFDDGDTFPSGQCDCTYEKPVVIPFDFALQ